MQNNIYVDLHVLQTVPPSNINWDDTGSPKTARYGGVTRARVSSQSWKKAMRKYFKEHEDKENLGIRTKKIVHSLAKAIMEKELSMDESSALKLAEEIFNEAKISTKDQEAKYRRFASSLCGYQGRIEGYICKTCGGHLGAPQRKGPLRS